MPVVHAGALLSAALCLAFVSAGSITEEEPPAGEGFDYYVLVLGWSPSYCATEEAQRRDDPHCAQKRRGFTLHGLWPQYFEGWPSDCWRGRRPWVPEQVIEE